MQGPKIVVAALAHLLVYHSAAEGQVYQKFSKTIDLVSPVAEERVIQGNAITFEWGQADFMEFAVFVYAGTEIVDDNPIRVFDPLRAGTTSVTLECANALPPGEYIWGVVGSTLAGYVSSGDRRFTIVAGTTCDSIDFNNDAGFFDPTDIDAFLSVYSEGPCIPSTATCNEIDFNNDGSLFDPCDINSFLLVYSEGPCTQCGQ